MKINQMVSDIFQAYEGHDMSIIFFGYKDDDHSRMGIVSVEGRNVFKITYWGGKWGNGLASYECPLQSAREYLATAPKERVIRLESVKLEKVEEMDQQRERLEAFPSDEGVKADFDRSVGTVTRTNELIITSNAEHALSLPFNTDKRTEEQQRKTEGLINWMVGNSHRQSIEARESVCLQLEKEMTRLYSSKRDQKKEEEYMAELPKPKVTQTDAQIRLANALGIRFSGDDNLGDMISDEINGFDALESVFDNLVSYTSAEVQTRSSKIEMVPDKCPFCSVANNEYTLFTFNNNGSYCFSCENSANIINTALAVRGFSYDSAYHGDSTEEMTEDESRAHKEEKAKKQEEEGARGKKSVWLGSYHKYNMRIYDVNNHDYLQIVDYFVNNKGLKRNFVTVHLLGYLDFHDIRYNHCNYSYKTGKRGIALNVPYVADRQRVRAIKRRLMDETLQQDAKRWNFNIYPKANHESHLWSTYKGESEIVVVVENQLDAAILNLISEKQGSLGGISFAAPLVPQKIDIALGASNHKDSGIVVLAYDLDDTGDRYVDRDFKRLKKCGFRAATYVWEGLEGESLLDTMTRTRFSLNDLHVDLIKTLGM